MRTEGVGLLEPDGEARFHSRCLIGAAVNQIGPSDTRAASLESPDSRRIQTARSRINLPRARPRPHGLLHPAWKAVPGTAYAALRQASDE